MSGDYLWDGSGEPDPEVKDLEERLRPLRGRPDLEFNSGDGPAPLSRVPPAPHVPGEAVVESGRPAPRRAVADRATWWRLLALAAALVLGAGLVLRWRASPADGWAVVRLAGSPLLGERVLSARGVLVRGERLVTDENARAKVLVGDIGQLDLEPNTSLRLISEGGKDHRVALERGTLRALISAPPRRFFVETPMAVAVDLGCAYALTVDDDGGGLLRVTFGWVSFERGGQEVFVPAGASCRLVAGVGPGTPYRDDAPLPLREALDTLDERRGDRAAAFASVLRNARPADGLTLVALLATSGPVERGELHDRLVQLVPAPAGAAREAAVRGEARLLDLWRSSLGLGELTGSGPGP